jgi:Zn-dependent peptidase ImmA (M78 family)
VNFGAADGLRIEVRWTCRSPRNAVEASRGRLRVSLNDWPVWFGNASDIGVDWTWIDLFETLGQVWRYVALEDGLPFGLPPERPTKTWARVEARWENEPEYLREGEEDQFETFLETHDLARAVDGVVLPSLWFVRTGKLMSVASEDVVLETTLDAALSVLEEFGNEFARRLSLVDDPRAVLAVDRWHSRSVWTPAEYVSIATGLDRSARKEVQAGLRARVAWELEQPTLELNEVLAAARLSSPVGASQIREIVHRIRDLPSTDTVQLDEYSRAASVVLEAHFGQPPFDQGYALATWLRADQKLRSDQRSDPEATLEAWDVAVSDWRLETPVIDAFGCWGARHGPAVVVNLTGVHAHSAVGRRATLAHEIAHLLVDRAGALPLVEVLGGMTPQHVESRARAFAAEFLLPRAEAWRRMAESDADPAALLRALQQHYGVSAELAAWQVRNEGGELPERTRSLLATKVSNPHAFH